MRKNLFLFFVVIAVSGLSQDADNRTNDQTNYLDLSLEELLNIDVVTGSKRPERSSDTPAVITAYTARDIEMMGYYTLADLADKTPGYSSYTIYGERVFETRGQKAGSFNNNKHLLMVDGIPINHAKAYKASTEEELPLYFADRVEFLRGPASSLYGVGAFYGVINIISKEQERFGTRIDGSVSKGNHDENMRVWANVMRRTDVGASKIFLGYFEKKASRDFVGTTDDPENLFWDDQRSFFLNLSHEVTQGVFKGFTPGFIYMQKQGGLGEHWMHGRWSTQLNDLTWITAVPYLKYQRDLGERGSLNGYVKSNRSREQGWWALFNRESYENYDGTGTPFLAYDQLIVNYEANLETQWDLGTRGNLVAGVNYDTRYQKGQPDTYNYAINADPGDPFSLEASALKDSVDFDTWSAYVQYQTQFNLLKGANLTLGFRQDNGKAGDNSYEQLSPRVAWIQKVNPRLNIKLMYGTALRAPGLKEVLLNQEAQANLISSGNNADVIGDLEAETIETLEAAAVYTSGKVVATLSLYRNKTENALDGARLFDQNVFINSEGETTADGFEIDFQIKPSRNWRLFANYSKGKALDDQDRELTDVPTAYGNLGINLQGLFGLDFSTTLMARHVNSYRVSDPTVARPDGHTLYDAHLSYHYSANTRVSLMGRNLGDEQAKYPKGGIIDVPLPGRNLTLSIATRF